MVEQGPGLLPGRHHGLDVNQVAAGVESEAQLSGEALSLQAIEIDHAAAAHAARCHSLELQNERP